MAYPSFDGNYTVGHYPSQGASGIVYREDLLDMAINLDKEKSAAVFLAAPKTTANGFTHDWLIDQLPATSTAGNAEGADWATATTNVRTRLGNIVQTFRRDFGVSLDAVEYSLKGRAPSVANEYEHIVQNYLLATEQSIDARIVANGTAVASASAAAATDAALMAGLRGWQVTGSNTAGTITGTGSKLTCVAINVAGAWSRSRFMALHEAMFNVGANPNTLAVDPGVKADITNDILGEVAGATASATGGALSAYPSVVRQIHTDSSATEYTADIQFMRTDYGRVAVLVDRFIPQSTATANADARVNAAFFLYDRSKVRIAFWRPLRHYPLPPGGDSMRGYVHCGATLELLHPNTLGVGYNVTT